MNPADQSVLSKTGPVIAPTVLTPVSGTTPGGKEREPRAAAVLPVTEISREIELPAELEQAGVTKSHEVVQLPPDVRKLGVRQSGASTSLSSAVALPNVVLPITDDEVITGLHSSVSDALTWLAYWCIKKLKKAHVAIKNIHGRIIRVKD